jgi:hypothetical protein
VETEHKDAEGHSGSMSTRSKGSSNDPLQLGSPAQVHSAANVCWVLDAVCQNGHIILQAGTIQRRSQRHRDQDVDSDVAGRRVGG